MPFDGLAVVSRFKPPRSRLDTLLASLGIEPVPSTVLEAHKAAEIARHPGSFFWRNPDLYLPMVMVSLLFTFVGALTCEALRGLSRPSVMGAGLITLLAIVCFFRLTAFTYARAPAVWREKPLYHFTDMPLAIKQLAQRVQDAADGDCTITFQIGTLYQESRILDPYLMVLRYDCETHAYERACLGIWDGKTIIEIARQRE